MKARLRFWGAWIGGGLAVAWALTFIWWLLLEPINRENRTVELVIPRGTAVAVAEGRVAPLVPERLVLGPNLALRVRNEDDVAHRIAGKELPAGATALVKADGGNQFSCTIHPAGSVGYSIDSRPNILATVLPSVVLGLPFGIIFGAAALVARRLRMDGDDDVPRHPLAPAGGASGSRSS
ncbi:MAG: hypothetical protein IT304_03385 [Dehalococcoidia bacterium]|nr:hypothetical protein [Dehalococcoidia bacterium]